MKDETILPGSRRMIVNGVKINWPVRNVDDMEMVLEKATGKVTFLERKQDFDGRFHMRLPKEAEAMPTPPGGKEEVVLEDTPELKAEWDALVLKKDTESWAKMPFADRQRYGVLKALYG